MTQDQIPQSTTTDLAELNKLFGPPPVLGSESTYAYYKIMARFVECFKPEDFMVQMLMKDLTDSTWEIMRYTRHKTLSMERRYPPQVEDQSKQRIDSAQRVSEMTPRQETEPSSPLLDRSFDLYNHVDASLYDVERILDKTPKELEHARALEEVFIYHEQLDRWLSRAIARRNDTLEQIGLYRVGLGHHLRQVSDEIIDAEFNEAKNEEAPHIVDGEEK